MSDLEGKKPKAFLNFSKKNKLGFLALEYSGHGKSSGKFTNGNISKWTKETTLLIKKIVKKNNCELDIMPVNYGEIFPVSGGLPVHKRPLQRQKYRLQELKRWSEFLKIKLNPEPKHFPSRSILPSKVIISVKILNFENLNDIAYAIMEGLWIKELNIEDPKNLKKILTRFIKTADEVIDFSESKRVEKEMNEYTKEAIDLAVFGAPTYIINDQIYWGQDRLDYVIDDISK